MAFMFECHTLWFFFFRKIKVMVLVSVCSELLRIWPVDREILQKNLDFEQWRLFDVNILFQLNLGFSTSYNAKFERQNVAKSGFIPVKTIFGVPIPS
jgi:hypothetical protein